MEDVWSEIQYTVSYSTQFFESVGAERAKILTLLEFLMQVKFRPNDMRFDMSIIFT